MAQFLIKPNDRCEVSKAPAASLNEVEKRLSLEDNEMAVSLYGPRNSHLKILSRLSGVSIQARGNQLRLTGDKPQTELAQLILKELYGLLAQGYPIYADDVEYAHRILSRDHKVKLKDIFLDKVFIPSKKRTVTPKSIAQKTYIEAIRRQDLVFGIGPAGTGKTYLAMALAVAALTSGDKRRIVLCRPAVEAGEKLGFLPGDLYEKVNPYLRPLYDALHDLMDFEQASRMVSKGVIEVAPLAFMRGRTLNDSFVILDEAQNTTTEQMKMFLTRLGFSSKAVVTGDVTQIDLPSGKRSGLVEAEDILQNIEGIAFVRFSQRDVIRHRLVQEIISAYQRAEAARQPDKANPEKDRG
ncbi:MAG: PhoH family protein [Deltaproteobacteria bacterium]|nr:PhoH family protein [Deltaproteobacteria bacterium]